MICFDLISLIYDHCILYFIMFYGILLCRPVAFLGASFWFFWFFWFTMIFSINKFNLHIFSDPIQQCFMFTTSSREPRAVLRGEFVFGCPQRGYFQHNHNNNNNNRGRDEHWRNEWMDFLEVDRGERYFMAECIIHSIMNTYAVLISPSEDLCTFSA